MKKLLLLSVFILTVVALPGQSRWAFGLQVEGGYSGEADLQEQTYPNPQFGDYYTKSELKRQPGAGGGLWTEYLFSHHFGLRLGVNYSHWRASSENESISYNTEDRMVAYGREIYAKRQRQLNIPLEGKFYFGNAKHRVRLFIKAGLQASYLLSEVNVFESYYGASAQSETYEYVYGEILDFNAKWLDVKRWDTSILGGLGVSMDRATLSLQKSWGINKKMPHYASLHDNCFGFGLYNSSRPYYVGDCVVRNLQQASLRFSYRLF